MGYNTFLYFIIKKFNYTYFTHVNIYHHSSNPSQCLARHWIFLIFFKICFFIKHEIKVVIMTIPVTKNVIVILAMIHCQLANKKE